MYRPEILSANVKKCFNVGDYQAIFLHDIISSGLINYEFIIEVFKNDNTIPYLYITSERSDYYGDESVSQCQLDEYDDHESHFLCMFRNNQHLNYGASQDWADSDKFEHEAARMLAEFAVN